MSARFVPSFAHDVTEVEVTSPDPNELRRVHHELATSGRTWLISPVRIHNGLELVVKVQHRLYAGHVRNGYSQDKRYFWEFVRKTRSIYYGRG